MPIDPYYRIARFGPSSYFVDYPYEANYAHDRLHAISAFHVIQDDLKTLFEYIDPRDENKDCYSFRTYELLLRIATEFESNCKEILQTNIYNPKYQNGDPRDRWNIDDYKKIDAANGVSKYSVKINIWRGSLRVISPLAAWDQNKSLFWYNNYNEVKHDRSGSFQKASLENVVTGAASLAALLYSQFGESMLDPYQLPAIIASDHRDPDYCSTHGNIFSINPYRGWSAAELYNESPDTTGNYSFQKFDFDKIP